MTKYSLSMTHQKGAALVVGLIVLLVMTLLGISSMSSITTELKIANNSQTHNTGFQVAASGIFAVLDVNSGIDTGAGGVQTFNYVAPDGLSRSNVTITYSDCQQAPMGFSLTQDITMKGVIHDIRSVAQVINANNDILGTVTHVNGVQTIRPGCPAGASPQ